MPIPEVERLGGWSMPTGTVDMPAERPPAGPTSRVPPQKPVVTGIAMLGMFYGLDHWANPLLQATKAQQRNYRRGWITWTVEQIARFVTPGKRFVASEISTGLLQNGGAPATTLRTFAYRWTQTQAMLAHFADTTAYAVGRIVHVKIPTEVHRQVRPVRVQVRRLRIGVIRTADDLNGLRIRVHHDVPKHGKTRLRKLERDVNGPVKGRIRHLGHRVDAQGREGHRHKTILGKISWVARFAGPVPLVLYAFRRLRLQSLLCRNTRQFTQEICASPFGTGRNAGRLLKELVGDLMTFLGIISVVTFADEVFGFTDFAVPYIKRGISEISALDPGDYLGAIGGPFDLLAPDYLD